MVKDKTSIFKKKNAEEAWNRILNRKPSLTDEEAKDVIKITKEIRKERGFRI